MAASSAPLVWIDCEMTGLDPDTDAILQIFCIITNGDLTPLDPAGWGTTVSCDAAKLAGMSEWCQRVHGASGLTAACTSAAAVTPQQAAAGLLAYIQQHVPEPRSGLLAGNSVHADAAFLRRGVYAPVMQHLHYRILDVSSIKEAARRWCGEGEQVVAAAPAKTGTHLAREDILESIAEARYYRDRIFRVSTQQHT